MATIVDEIIDLFVRFGAGHYGEDVSLEQHMLQAAAMAEALHAPEDIVVAALVHDVGHFLHADSEIAVDEGRDLAHETLGATWLSHAFPQNVTAPIALHVRAKRYLCAVEPDYFASLSDASRASLVVQGGIMNNAEVSAFTREPGFEAAVLLRRCDDRGKEVAAQVRPLERYRGLLAKSLR